MILPSSPIQVSLVLVACFLFWGLWPSTQKAAGRLRFEIFCFDFSLGALALAVLMAFTFGMMGQDLNFEDNLLVAGRRPMAMALGAGVVFALGNMLLIAAISISGLAAALPMAFGVSLAVAALFSYSGSLPVYASAGLALLASVAAAAAHLGHTAAKRTTRKGPSGTKAVFLSLAAGLLLSAYMPLLAWSGEGDIGLIPYTGGFLFALGVALTTPVFNLYFMNLPVAGEPLPFRQYLSGPAGARVLGVLGGALWYGGLIAYLVAGRVEQPLGPSTATAAALRHGGPVFAGLTGLLLWREFSGGRGRGVAAAALLLLASSAGLLYLGLRP